MAKIYYYNKECGNILTREEMVKEGRELYDLGDDTCGLDYSEYYELYIDPSENDETKIYQHKNSKLSNTVWTVELTGNTYKVYINTTYVGTVNTEEIEKDIFTVLDEAGFTEVKK